MPLYEEHRIGTGTLYLRLGNLVEEDVDAIVNAANTSLLGGGGVDGAIHRAGGPQILEECRAIVARIGRCAPGQAVSTSGGKLKARHVIHTVGPVWNGGKRGEAETLQRAYRNSLERGAELRLRSIAFPSISTGAYRFPVEIAAPIALETVRSAFERLERVGFVLFDVATYEAYRSALQSLVQSAASSGGSANCSDRTIKPIGKARPQ